MVFSLNIRESKNVEPVTGSTTVLSVDDQKSFLLSFKLAAKLLRIKSYALYQTSEEMLSDLPPNPSKLEIVLVDWNMPTSRMVQEELIVELIKQMPAVPVYVLSTSLDESEMKRAEKAGAKGWVHKASMIDALKRFNKEYKDKTEFYVWK